MANDVIDIVESFAPYDGQTNVSLEAQILITFRESMDSSTLNEKTVYLKKIGDSQEKVDANYSYAGIERTLTLTPLEPLEKNVMYRIQVLSKDKGPKTAFGARSLTVFNSQFTTKTKQSEEIPTEPVDPEEPEDEDIFEPETRGLVLLNSFPEQNGLIDVRGQIVLEFSEEVDSKDLKEKVYIKKKSLHPLLDIFPGSEKIVPVPAEIKVGTTHLMIVSGLDETTDYQLVVEEGLKGSENILEENLVVFFQTPFEKMYANIQDLKLILGYFAESFTDSELMRLIYQQSKSVYELMKARDEDVENWASELPYAASQYVLYRSAYQAMVGQAIASSSGIKDAIKLGDLSVEQSESSSSSIVDLLELFKKEVDRWWDILNGRTDEEIEGVPNFVRTPGTATRGGENSPYPEFITRVPFNEIGGAAGE